MADLPQDRSPDRWPDRWPDGWYEWTIGISVTLLSLFAAWIVFGEDLLHLFPGPGGPASTTTQAAPPQSTALQSTAPQSPPSMSPPKR